MPTGTPIGSGGTVEGTYITKANMQTYYGNDSILNWSQLDKDLEQSTYDDDRITAAIAWAEAHIEDRFRGSMYAVPFSTLGNTLKQFMIIAAAYYLNRPRMNYSMKDKDRDPLLVEYEDMMAEIDLILMGVKKFDEISHDSQAPEAPHHIEGV
jgi:phage gp36-like protein